MVDQAFSIDFKWFDFDGACACEYARTRLLTFLPRTTRVRNESFNCGGGDKPKVRRCALRGCARSGSRTMRLCVCVCVIQAGDWRACWQRPCVCDDKYLIGLGLSTGAGRADQVCGHQAVYFSRTSNLISDNHRRARTPLTQANNNTHTHTHTNHAERALLADKRVDDV